MNAVWHSKNIVKKRLNDARLKIEKITLDQNGTPQRDRTIRP